VCEYSYLVVAIAAEDVVAHLSPSALDLPAAGPHVQIHLSTPTDGRVHPGPTIRLTLAYTA
jgi:hypothetical protein